MCRQCICEHFFDHEPNTPIDEERWASIEWPGQTPEMKQLTEAVYRLYSLPNCEVGGPLHIVTDDYNVEDDSLDYCENTIEEHWSVRSAPTAWKGEIVNASRAVIDLMRGLSELECVVVLGRMDGIIP